MKSSVIRVENLGKRYILGCKQESERYSTLRDAVASTAKSLTRRLNFSDSSYSPVNSSEFWALKDVSFEIKQGDRVGIIGRNGAGKSTLLKILSRITEPTQGRITINGRVASLLEVGTGFHPELTGRENIYLNGAILGMSKAEINRKFDEIVDFAEVEKFLDTPVKRYSSGMYVRLAFAVAAHLEPEILVVDEVLAVGDAQFQEKCLGKMKDVGEDGRTVIFVSHQLDSIRTLCNIGVLLNEGQISHVGDINETCEKYLTSQSKSSDYIHCSPGVKVNNRVFEKQAPSQVIRILSVDAHNPYNETLGARTGESLKISATYSTVAESRDKLVSPAFLFICRTTKGQEIFRISTSPISGFDLESLHTQGNISLLIDELPLVSGPYVFDVIFGISGTEAIVKLEEVLEIDVRPKDIYQSGCLMDQKRGLITLKHCWNHSRLVSENSKNIAIPIS